MDFYKNELFRTDNTMSLNDVLRLANRDTTKEKKEESEDSKKIKINITPEEFKSDYKSKMISSSEVCELLTQRLGTIFSDYEGCKDIEFVNSPVAGIALVFTFKGSDNAHDTRIKALEAFNNVGNKIKGDTKELAMISSYNGASSMYAKTSKGIVSEATMGFRLTNEAIDILKDTVIDFGKDNQNHDNFRKQCVSYALSADGIHNILIVQGITIESVLGFIYGKQYDYSVAVGSHINTNSYSGRLLEIRQLHPETTRELLRKYVNRQIVSDGLYRPSK